VDGITAIRRLTGGWNDRCEPFTWTKAASEILAKAIRKFINVTSENPASILTSLFTRPGGCNRCGDCCTGHVRHTERIDLYAFNRAASAN
jgi:hypothetical protein